MKVISIHQPNYLPWIGYFYKIVSADTFVFLDNVDYQYGNSSSVTNKAKIKTNSGVQLLSVPVKKTKGLRFIKEMPVDNGQPWQRKHLNSIKLTYCKSPFFEPVFELLEGTLNSKTELLATLNETLIANICNYLLIPTNLVKASDLSIEQEDRNIRLIEICKKLNGDIYLSGNGGKKYNNATLFNEKGIEIKYTEFVHPTYNQLHGTFIPNLSVIDMLFMEGSKLSLIKGN